MSEQLRHYWSAPVEFTCRTYPQAEPHSYHKPQGFWVSVEGEDDWPSWCRREGHGVETLTVEHVVTLNPSAIILRLGNEDALEEFHTTYSVEETEGIYCDPQHRAIDWRKVAANYDGIIIAPYQWGRRYTSWYYGWDCASGCIWNTDAIAWVAVA